MIEEFLNIRNDVKVFYPGKTAELWTDKGKLRRETDFGVDC